MHNIYFFEKIEKESQDVKGCFVLQMRHVYVVIDCSRSMEDQDLKPNRLTSTLKVKQSCLPGHQQLRGVIVC